MKYSDLAVGPLERAERLEQLRALENGFKIRVVETDYESLGVDTPGDLDRVRELIRTAQASVLRGDDPSVLSRDAILLSRDCEGAVRSPQQVVNG